MEVAEKFTTTDVLLLPVGTEDLSVASECVVGRVMVVEAGRVEEGAVASLGWVMWIR